MTLRFALALALAVSAFSLDASAQRGRGNGGYNGYTGITVYEDPNFRGDSFTFRNEVRDLREEGLNDRISSLEVDGNQAWEVCRDVNFGGGCRVFQGHDRRSPVRGLERSHFFDARRRVRAWQQQPRRDLGQFASQRQQPPVAAGAVRSPEFPRRRTKCAEQRDQPRRRERPQRPGVWRDLGTVRRLVPQCTMRDGQRERSRRAKPRTSERCDVRAGSDGP